MTESLSRAFTDLEIRSDGTGRTIHGIVVPFGAVSRVNDGGPSYDEAFQRGAFARTINAGVGRVKLLAHHNKLSNPLGRATLLREDTAGLYGEFHVSKTRAGDEALELVHDGSFDAFSVGFRPMQHVRREGVLWRTEVALRETSLVTFPAYEGALIGGVRSEEDLVALILNKLRTSTPDEDPLARDTSESAEPVTASDDPASAADHSLTHAMFQFRAQCAERGL